MGVQDGSSESAGVVDASLGGSCDRPVGGAAGGPRWGCGVRFRSGDVQLRGWRCGRSALDGGAARGDEDLLSAGGRRGVRCLHGDVVAVEPDLRPRRCARAGPGPVRVALGRVAPRAPSVQVSGQPNVADDWQIDGDGEQDTEASVGAELVVLAAPVPRVAERTAARFGDLAEAPVVLTEGAHLPLVGLLLGLPALEMTGLLDVATATFGSMSKGFYGLRATLLTGGFPALLREPRAEGATRPAPARSGSSTSTGTCACIPAPASCPRRTSPGCGSRARPPRRPGSPTPTGTPSWSSPPPRHSPWRPNFTACCPTCAPSSERRGLAPSCSTAAGTPRRCSPRSCPPGSTCSPTTKEPGPDPLRPRSPPPTSPPPTGRPPATSSPNAASTFRSRPDPRRPPPARGPRAP